jgi:molybdopterin/thiamine biosynthesis adenylyltransferase
MTWTSEYCRVKRKVYVGVADDKNSINLAEELTAETQDRYHRLKLIKWWDQQRLQNARVMVVGAGALGNEIVKNLALLGVGNILIGDFDHVEPSNLSRSVLFRREDEGRRKAEVAAERAKELNPDINTAWFHGDITCELGLGVFRRMDVVIGGLDNREARIAVNSACWRLGVPYVDGGTHTFEGQVRVFASPNGPCYECTLSAESYKAIQERIRCNLLLEMSGREAEGKVATTPVASSIIAGLEVQEAIELIHGMEPPTGKTIIYNGYTHEVYVSSFEPKDSEWHRHREMETSIPVMELPAANSGCTFRELLTAIRSEMGEEAILDFERNVVGQAACEKCSAKADIFRPLKALRHADMKCPHCGTARTYDMIYTATGNEPWLDRAVSDLGIPYLDIVPAHLGCDVRYFELTADAPSAGFWEGPITGKGGIPR